MLSWVHNFFRILFSFLVSCGAGLAGGNPHKIKVFLVVLFFCFSVFILVFFWHTIDVQEFMRRIRRRHKFFLLSAVNAGCVVFFLARRLRVVAQPLFLCPFLGIVFYF